MQTLTAEQMMGVDGFGFWEGFACGAGVIGSIAATISPDPLSKAALWSLYSGTIAACGMAFF